MLRWVTGRSLCIAGDLETGSHPGTHEDIVYDWRVRLIEHAARINSVAEARRVSVCLERDRVPDCNTWMNADVRTRRPAVSKAIVDAQNQLDVHQRP